MDPRYTGEMLRHLEKQNEHLMDAYRSMSHELHKLQVLFRFSSVAVAYRFRCCVYISQLISQPVVTTKQNSVLENHHYLLPGKEYRHLYNRRLEVEEEMLMRKFYELMSAQSPARKNEEESSTLPDDGRNGQSSALIPACNNEPIGQSSASLIPVCSDEPIGQSCALTPVSGNEQ
ncbi:hypothetical protein RHGRI_002259 [Rhododendron griersonianum]|uniref:Uncharacterized protein n=1 Tax=Rhododendron griersonianum TaxID=479676 RepID=A0AAV6LNA7_9ERIC|nr:hypothetical protein RHGRI_002259 [Rhododendron griersonianum]